MQTRLYTGQVVETFLFSRSSSHAPPFAHTSIKYTDERVQDGLRDLYSLSLLAALPACFSVLYHIGVGALSQ